MRINDGDSGSCAAIHRRKTILKLNKPIYAGFAILELSKLIMYEHYYDYLKPLYNDDITLCFTDTDSLLYHVYTQDVYKDMQMHQHLYDTAEYHPDHFLYSKDNTKVPGKFSDETNGIPIKSSVGLRSKMYAIKLGKGEGKRRAKGIPQKIIANDTTYNDYVTCLETGNVTSVTYSSIQSKDMKLYTKTTKKIGLSAYDDKRYVLDDGKATLAYGHCDIKPK